MAPARPRPSRRSAFPCAGLSCSSRQRPLPPSLLLLHLLGYWQPRVQVVPDSQGHFRAGVHWKGDKRVPLHACRRHASKLQATSLLSALNVSVSKVSAGVRWQGDQWNPQCACRGQCRFCDGSHVNKFAHEFSGTGIKRQQSLNTVVMSTSSFSNFVGTPWHGAVDIETVARPPPFFVWSTCTPDTDSDGQEPRG